jgi:2-phospho-L-lactate guanylyltransferase
LSSNYAIVPVRKFSESKQRLKTTMSSAKRAELTLALLRRVLSELQNSKVDKIILVASDDAEARKFLPTFSKVEIIKESVHHGGVNSAMRDGMARILSPRNANFLLIPSDLPMLSSDAINRVVDNLADYELIINPSSRKDGTNLLAFREAKTINLHYDDNSMENHIMEAEKKKLHYRVIVWDELLFDVDDPEDLAKLLNFYNTKDINGLIQKLAN